MENHGSSKMLLTAMKRKLYGRAMILSPAKLPLVDSFCLKSGLNVLWFHLCLFTCQTLKDGEQGLCRNVAQACLVNGVAL
eukprot:763091-Pelagomonas_calceolata.AAC.2